MKEHIKSLLLLIALVLFVASCGGAVSESGTTTGSTSAAKPRFAYAVNSSDNTVSMYTVNAETGQLRHNGYITTGSTPYCISVDPSNRFAYVATSGTNNNVSIYQINQSNGVLSFVGFATAGTNPRSITVDPSGKFVYATNADSANISMLEITSDQGELIARQTVNIGTNPNPITFHPSGKFAYVPTPLTNSIIVYDVNGKGELASKGTATTGATPRVIAIDPSGKFAYTANYNGNTLSMHAVNPDTGQLRYNGTIATSANPISISIDPSGQFVYAANNNSNTISAYTINRETGSLTFAGNVDAGANPYSVIVDSTGHFLYAANQTSNDLFVYSVNANTGLLTKESVVTGRNGPISMAIASGPNAVKYVAGYVYAGKTSSNIVSIYATNQSNGYLYSAGTATIGWASYQMTVHPSNKYIYVPTGSDTIEAYAIQLGTGALSSVGHVGTGSNPYAVAIDPSGRFAYVANAMSSNVSIYTINQTTGVLQPGTPATATAGTLPFIVVIDPSGRFAYVVNAASRNVLVYSIHPNTGALTQTNGGITFSTDESPQSVTFDPSGRFAYVVYMYNVMSPSISRVSIYAINRVSGALGTPVNSFNIGQNSTPFMIEPSGRFAYVVQSTVNINPPSYSIVPFTINQDTGNLTVISSGSHSYANSYFNASGIDPSGKYLYSAIMNHVGGGLQIGIYNINQTAGTLSPGPSFLMNNEASFLTIAEAFQ